MIDECIWSIVFFIVVVLALNQKCLSELISLYISGNWIVQAACEDALL